MKDEKERYVWHHRAELGSRLQTDYGAFALT